MPFIIVSSFHLWEKVEGWREIVGSGNADGTKTMADNIARVTSIE
jgi:hypothetical protein